jgi:hypothetical protein
MAAVHYVETANVSQVWPMVEPFLLQSINSSPDFPEWYPNYNIHHLQMFLTNGAWLLIVEVDDAGKICGACTVSFVNYPLHRVAFITAIGGKLITSQEMFQQLKALLKQRYDADCEKIGC